MQGLQIRSPSQESGVVGVQELQDGKADPPIAPELLATETPFLWKFWP
jgi:hypothetical protein